MSLTLTVVSGLNGNDWAPAGRTASRNRVANRIVFISSLRASDVGRFRACLIPASNCSGIHMGICRSGWLEYSNPPHSEIRLIFMGMLLSPVHNYLPHSKLRLRSLHFFPSDAPCAFKRLSIERDLPYSASGAPVEVAIVRRDVCATDNHESGLLNRRC